MYTKTMVVYNKMELNVQEWKEYQVDKLFTVVLSKGDIKEDDMDSGTVRLVSSGETDNGIVAHIDSKGDGRAEIFDGNVITADMFCNAYYQDESFYAVSHGRVNILQPEFNLNSHIGLFISTIINNEKYKYSYGRALYSNVVSSMVIKLPTQIDKANDKYIIDKNRTYSNEGYIPDWQFMEDYIKSLHHKPITTKVKSGLVKELDVDNWKEFKVSDLFNVKYGINMELNTCIETTSDDPEGIAFVARTAENNGVSAYVKRIEGKEPQPAETITVAGGGSVLSTFVQKRPFYSGRDLYLLIAKEDINLNVKIFISTVLFANQYRYSYGRQANKTLPDLILKLPIKRDSNGNSVIDNNRTYSDSGYIPDWQFMEDYINSLPYSDRI